MYISKPITTDDLEKHIWNLKLHAKSNVWELLAIFVNTFASEPEKKHWFEVLYEWRESENKNNNNPPFTMLQIDP